MEKIYVLGVCGRYFAGKTLISNIIAKELGFLYLIHTDLVRILLSTVKEDKFLQIPTYRLRFEDIIKQFYTVSFYTKTISEVLMNRGENHIIEGLHFDPILIDYITRHGFLVYVMNDISLNNKIKNKKLTRKRLRAFNGNYVHISKLNDPSETMYLRYSEIIFKIDNYLDKICLPASHYVIRITEDLDYYYFEKMILEMVDNIKKRIFF